MMSLPISSFDIAALPKIIFGEGRIGELPGMIQSFGRRVLIVTGAQSFQTSANWRPLIEALESKEIVWEHATISREPSPASVDGIVQRFSPKKIEVVCGIGGGSAMDGAKAVAGLLARGNSVMDHLEGVGRGSTYLGPLGPAVPLIAVPTTAGTGSEATKNAVLSKRGPDGFKKSFRHDSLIPKVALLDPGLMRTLPREWIAAQAMDALTQLIESFTSIEANAFTGPLALAGIEAVKAGLFAAVDGTGSGAASGRSALMYAALLSGICLAQTGLGVVHGLASPLGAFSHMAHGQVCGTLLAAATQVNIEALRTRDPNNRALRRYARIGRVLTDQPCDTSGDSSTQNQLVARLHRWVERLKMPRLGQFGINRQDFAQIIRHCRGGSMQTNPLVLTDEEIESILAQRL